MTADHTLDVGGTGVGGPCDPLIPRPQLPGRGPEADPAEGAVALRADPVAHLAAGRARPSQWVVRRHHRLPETAIVGLTHRFERDRAEILQQADQLGVGDVTGRDGGHDGRIGHAPRRRKLEPHALGERRQHLRRRRQARTAERVAPTGALAKLACQTVTGGVGGAQRASKPVKRLRIEMAETNLHARSMHETNHLYKSDTLKGGGEQLPLTIVG